MSGGIAPVYLSGGLPYTRVMQRTKRTERLEARVSAELKERLSHAAALEGRSLTEFITSHLEEAACRAIEAAARWELGQRDREEFVQALLQPPEPNPALRQAFERYRSRTAPPPE